MMKKQDSVDDNFKVGDRVRHKKNGFEGVIDRFEWNGLDRSVLIPSGKANRSWYIFAIHEIELIPDLTKKEDIRPEPIFDVKPQPKKRGRKKKGNETGKSN